jgi:signal transduction histidine kinase
MAAAAGLVLAALLGRLIAYRAMRPIGQAIVRQQRFIADASHELRTPLTQVHTRAQLLRRGLRRIEGEGQLHEDAERLVRGTRLLGEIVDELLTSAQLRAEPSHRERVDLLAVAEDVVAAEDDRARAGEVTITVVPDAGPHHVGGAATALRRVVSSLVDNALGHTPAGGHIEVHLNRTPDTVVLTVADDGVGLSDVDERRLFERFARGDHGSGRRFGLGLALVRDVVESHDGTVGAAGRPDGGAAFTVRLAAWVDPPAAIDPPVAGD